MKNFQSLLLFIFALFFSINQAFCQEEEITWRDRLFFGGNFGLVVGDVTIIEITPLVGYRLTPRLSAGIDLKYEFYKSSGRAYGNTNVSSFSTSVFGGGLFSDFVCLKNFPTNGISFFVHAEDELLNLENKYFRDPSKSGRYILNSVLVGGGIRQRTGRRSSINIMLLWNLNETQYSPYSSNPILKFNFIFQNVTKVKMP